MKFCLETSKDLSKYFNGTFVKFIGIRGVFSDGTECAPADELVHFIDSVGGNVIKGKRFENGETVPFQFMLYSEHSHSAPEIEFILPKKSFFNTDKGAMLLQRIPARQYRRGICGDNTHIALLKGNGGWQNVGVNFENLDGYVRKPAFPQFHPSDNSYAVSRRIAVANKQVLVDQTVIGTINYEKKYVAVVPLFASEIQAILKESGQANEWEVRLPDSPRLGAGKKLVNKQGDLIIDEVE